MTRALVIALLAAACGHAAPAADPRDAESHDGVFSHRAFKPKSFVAKVSGSGRPVIFIPGLGCPGEMWNDTIERLKELHDVEAHVLTLAGFAGQPPIKPPLAATVRHEIVRYIRANQLDRPIVVGHSMGGAIAYWIAETAPDLLGGTVVVDAGPALADTDPATARTLRNMWAQAGDDELPVQVNTAYSSMVVNPKHMAPFIDAIVQSDRQTMGDAIYELVKTDLRPQLKDISRPLLLVLHDGGYAQLYRTQIAPVSHREVVVVPNAGHFVMLDAPEALARAIDAFAAKLPAPPRRK